VAFEHVIFDDNQKPQRPVQERLCTMLNSTPKFPKSLFKLENVIFFRPELPENSIQYLASVSTYLSHPHFSNHGNQLANLLYSSQPNQPGKQAPGSTRFKSLSKREICKHYTQGPRTLPPRKLISYRSAVIFSSTRKQCPKCI